MALKAAPGIGKCFGHYCEAIVQQWVNKQSQELDHASLFRVKHGLHINTPLWPENRGIHNVPRRNQLQQAIAHWD